MVWAKQRKKKGNVLTDGVSLKCYREKKTKLVLILPTSLVIHTHSFTVCHSRKQGKKQLSECHEWNCSFVRQINTLLMFEHFVFEAATFEWHSQPSKTISRLCLSKLLWAVSFVS